MTVEVNEAPDNLISLKNISPPIAVFNIPKTIAKNKLWLDGFKFSGFSKMKERGIRIKKAKKVEPDKTKRG